MEEELEGCALSDTGAGSSLTVPCSCIGPASVSDFIAAFWSFPDRPDRRSKSAFHSAKT